MNARGLVRRAVPGPARLGDEGSISLYILGLAVMAAVVIAGAAVVTSAHITRMTLLDVADGAALAAANALDESTGYDNGVGASVPISRASVSRRAAEYLRSRPRPARVTAWRLTPSTGSPDGGTAVVGLTADVELPVLGTALRAIGGSITISVESSARADLDL
jgi:hypothetical protein